MNLVFTFVSVIIFFCSVFAQAASQDVPAATKNQLSLELIQGSELKQVINSYEVMARATINRKKNEPTCAASADCILRANEIEKEFIKQSEFKRGELIRKMQRQLEDKFTPSELSTLIKFNKHSLIHRFKSYMSSEESSAAIMQEVDEIKTQLSPAGND